MTRVATEDETGPLLGCSDGFAGWLRDNACSLVLASPDRERVFFIGLRSDGSLWAHERHIDGCKTVAASGYELWLATTYQLWRFQNVLPAGKAHRDTGADRFYCPRASYITGALFIHEIVANGTDRPRFVNTQYSCIAEPALTASFRPVWQPKFISALAPEDRCHLNGVAHHDLMPRYATARGKHDTPNGWRADQATGGLVIDVDSGEIVSDQLSMPHSPRCHDDQLYVLNTGTCEFGRVDIDTGRFDPICPCPGYARGLAILGNHAVVGLSLSRKGDGFQGLPVSDSLKRDEADAICGLVVVDLTTGEAVHSFQFRHTIREIASVGILAGVRQPFMLGFRDEEKLSTTISLTAAA